MTDDEDHRKTVVFRKRHLEQLEALQEDDDRDVRSRSEAIRTILDEYEELQTRCEELHTENERLENRIMKLIDERQEHQELVRYVDEEEKRRRAGIVQRWKWKLFGED